MGRQWVIRYASYLRYSGCLALLYFAVGCEPTDVQSPDMSGDIRQDGQPMDGTPMDGTLIDAGLSEGDATFISDAGLSDGSTGCHAD